LDLTQENSFELLKKYLGVPKFDAEYELRSHRKFPPGTLNILTVTGFTGFAMTVECVFDQSHPDKKGQLTSSGNLKNVLQESLTVSKINAFRYLNPDQIKMLGEKNIHVHFLSGA